MDIFPTEYDRPEDSTARDDDVYTEIHMDPASIPVAPAQILPFPYSEGEEDDMDPEEDPEEAPDSEDAQHMSDDEESSDAIPSGDDQADQMSDDPTADPMPVDVAPATSPARSPTPFFYIHHLPSFGGPRTIRTPRKRVRFPRTPYASTSRAPAHTLASPPQSTPSLDLDIARLEFSHSTSPSPTSSHARADSSVAPAQDAAASPVVSPYHVDPAMNFMMEHLHDVEIDVFRLKEDLTKIPGPDNFEDHERHLKHLDRKVGDMGACVHSILERLSVANHHTYETHQQVFARGGLSDQFRDLQIRNSAEREENRQLRSRVRVLENRLDYMQIG